MIPLRNIRRFFYKALRQPGYALRVFGKRINAYFYYRFGNGKSSLPEAITLFLTYRCNLRCKMCGQWGESGVTKKESRAHIREELSYNELAKFIDDISSFKPNITLFGGEPLLHSSCTRIIKYIKEKGMHCLMITNGFLLKGNAKEIVGAGLDELNVSLDAARELHDGIRGMEGLFERIIEGLKEINLFKKEKRTKRPFINLQCTITRYNYNSLEKMLDVAEQASAASLTFHNLIFLGKGLMDRQRGEEKALDFSSGEWDGFMFEPGVDPAILWDKIREVVKKASAYSFNVDFYPNFSMKGLREYYENSSYFPSEYPARCLSPWIAAYIFPDGDLRPCLNFDYSFGNIRENGFARIWNSPAAIRYRKFLKEKNIFPVCVRCTEFYRY